MDAADHERLRTWAIEIGKALLPVHWRLEGDEYRAVGQGGLTINRRHGAWYCHSANRGGWSAVGLIEFIAKYNNSDAVKWATRWLASHPELGSCTGEPNERDESAPASAAAAREVFAALVDIIGPAGEMYLRSRALHPPYPSCVRFLPNARTGEHGVVGILTSYAHKRVVGLQITYIDPFGRKSTVLPYRRTLMLERAKDAVFDMPSDGAGPC